VRIGGDARVRSGCSRCVLEGICCSDGRGEIGCLRANPFFGDRCAGSKSTRSAYHWGGRAGSASVEGLGAIYKGSARYERAYNERRWVQPE